MAADLFVLSPSQETTRGTDEGKVGDARLSPSSKAQCLAVTLAAFYSGGVRSGIVRFHEVSAASASALKLPTLPVLVTEDSVTVREAATIMSTITRLTDTAKALEESTPYAQGEVSQWLSFASERQFIVNHPNTLNTLNTHLLTRTFLASVHITLADLVMYPSVYAWMINASEKERLLYGNVSRWFDHIQHLRGIKGVSRGLSVVAIPTTESSTRIASELSRRMAGLSLATPNPPISASNQTTAPPVSSSPSDAEAQSHTPTPMPSPPSPGQQAAVTGTGKPEFDREAKKAEKKEKKEKKAKKETAASTAVESDERPVEDITRLDIRVGLVKKVWKHPKADKLYCEEIDIGESSVRQIASGLVPFMGPEELEDSKVIVLANLKPKELVGFSSHGMVLCANLPDSVELVRPPNDAKIGDKIYFEGLEGQSDEVLNSKTKKDPFLAVKKDLVTSADLIALYKDKPFMTSHGPCRVKSGANGQIS